MQEGIGAYDEDNEADSSQHPPDLYVCSGAVSEIDQKNTHAVERVVDDREQKTDFENFEH